MNQELKLSELMKAGAAQLPPYRLDEGYFDDVDTPQAADAIGCMLYAIDMVEPGGLLYDTLPVYLRDILYTRISMDVLPADVREMWEGIPHFSWESILLKIVHYTDLNISRERAIQLVEELGY